ncbi:MAG: DUF1573 domain-containing protein [Cyclobacteriaceae bacterium]|nr:DUF1573 domain-containing protein [Cyclobacteriaceae bacterium]
MKTTFNKLFILFFMGVIAFGCTNKEMESRIAKLEGKVAELETKNGSRALPSNPTTAAPVVEETKPDGPLPSFRFPEENFDFGTIKEGEVVNHSFTFTNSGDAPLIITSATASCGCTVPDWPKEPIAPGGTGVIKVQFNSQNKPGVQNKTVSITANTYPKVTRLNIKANVTKADNPL